MKDSEEHVRDYMRQQLYGEGILGELLHTAWRKGCFAMEADEIHDLIREMDRKEWGNYLRTVIEWLRPSMVDMLNQYRVTGWQPVKGFVWEDDQTYLLRENKVGSRIECVEGCPHDTPEMFWDLVMTVPELLKKEKS